MINVEELQYELSINIAQEQMEALKKKRAFEDECEWLGIKRLE